ncbi:MAG TPA: dihydrofolate reductase family protein [Gemmatimonadales bacterium]|jgi:dihydrofolate reductase
MHTSLDGFVAGPKGEMDWINVGDEMFEYAGQRTREADTALYGRVTWQMMESYWPTAADQPNPSAHDIEHSRWYNTVEKVVASRTMKGASLPRTTIVDARLGDEVRRLKRASGRSIVMFGSPTVAHELMSEELIDDYWLFVNPILLGEGIPLFKDVRRRASLKLVANQVFSSGVVCLHYEAQM